MTQLWKDKFKYTSIHFALTALVVSSLLAVVFYYWYPHPYWQADGAWNVIGILFMVDLVLGPTLTFVLYKKDKKGMKFDIAFIATIQLAAFLYASFTIYTARPYYMVFAVDRFEIVSKNEIDASKIKFPELLEKPQRGPIMVYTEFPEDPVERNELTMKILFEGEPDIARRPDMYQPYQDHVDKVLASGRPLTDLLTYRPKAEEAIVSAAAKHDKDPNSLTFFPVVSRSESVLFLNGDTGLPVDGLGIDPWLTREQKAELDLIRTESSAP